jgi:predicted Zn-dependent protease
MKVRSPFFAACCFAATALSVALAGCSSSESKAREGYGEYQAAIAAGDLLAARRALLEIVAVKDDDPAYWEELGKVQVQLGSLSDAYYAYTRAHELDRTNGQVLASMTQLALLSGNIDLAEKHAQQLELISADAPAVKLVYGYSALRRQNFDEADKQADYLLQALPFEPGAKLLKARILLARGKHEDAAALLEKQVLVRPDDAGSLKALMALHERYENWPGVASAASRVVGLDPKDTDAGLTAIDAELRSKNISGAMRAARPFLKPDVPGEQVDSVLWLWAERWKGPEAINAARQLSRSAGPQQRLAYAGYFNEVGRPQDAIDLAGGGPQLPVSLANSSANAIVADSLAQSGRAAEAKQLLDTILKMEPDHVYALRARINLEIRTGKAIAAVSDAQRLVSVLPKSARDRLLLARAYSAAGDGRQLDRTLWDAFHEIPANRDLYEALRGHVAKVEGMEAADGVDEEYRHQQDAKLVRDFI